MATLPQGVTARQFEQALAEFRSALGAEWVFWRDEDVDLYRDAYSIYWGEKEERRASAAVAPASVEQVQAVVRIANQYKLPLFAISTGKNLTYGGSAPNYTGSVVVDLKRMNKVLEIDDKRNFVIVEPGVSYFDLYRYIQDRKLKLWIDCPDPGWGSLVGNSLDHGIGYTYGVYRDHFGAHCGMEVVLPNGEVMRTGMGALPGAKSWADYRYGFGPTLDGLFAQGNFGIVTKMGFWLMPQPEAVLNGTVLVPRYEDIGPLVEHVNYLEDSGLIAQPSYFSPVTGGAFGPDAAISALLANGWPTNDQVNAFVRGRNVPCWGVSVPMLGPEATIQGTWGYIKQRIGAAIPGAVFPDAPVMTFPLTKEQEDRYPHKVTVGIPNMEIFSLVARSPINNPDDPPAGHADFTCVIPRTGEALLEAQKVFYKAYRDRGEPTPLSPFWTPVTWHQRTFIFPVIVWTYHEAERNRKSRELFSQLIDLATQNGWAEYRTAPAFQDQLAAQFSFGDHSLLRFAETLKDAADPNGILSPGRGGIWPRHLRAEHKGKQI
jgi:(+)-pinoresinol hydroxylase